MRSRVEFVLAIGLFVAAAPPLVLAQSATEPKSGCRNAPAVTATTPSETGPSSGTAPGNSGSTGWTGGTGGSNIDTTAAGAARSSEQQHPATAQGVDPTVPRPNADSRC